MTYAEAITRLSQLRTVKDGEQLLHEYADGISEGAPIATATADLGWLTGELALEDRVRAFELCPWLAHPVLGRRTEWTDVELILAGYMFAFHGHTLPLIKADLETARKELERNDP